MRLLAQYLGKVKPQQRTLRDGCKARGAIVLLGEDGIEYADVLIDVPIIAMVGIVMSDTIDHVYRSGRLTPIEAKMQMGIAQPGCGERDNGQPYPNRHMRARRQHSRSMTKRRAHR